LIRRARFAAIRVARRSPMSASGAVGFPHGARTSQNPLPCMTNLLRREPCRPRPLIARPRREESRPGPIHRDCGLVIRSRASSARRPPRFGRRPRPALTRPGRAAKRPGETSTRAGRIQRRLRVNRSRPVPIVSRPREVFPRTERVIPVTIPAGIGKLRTRTGRRMTSCSRRTRSSARRPRTSFKLPTPSDRLAVGSRSMPIGIGRGRTVRRPRRSRSGRVEEGREPRLLGRRRVMTSTGRGMICPRRGMTVPGRGMTGSDRLAAGIGRLRFDKNSRGQAAASWCSSRWEPRGGPGAARKVSSIE
jgi:hypothetical protein